MSKKLILAVKELYMNRTTPDRIARGHNLTKLRSPSFPHSQLSPKAVMKPPELPFLHEISELKQLNSFFKQEVDGPISIHSEIYKAAGPQKCLMHNNLSTMFCVNDQKPLCAICMYQNNIHKTHKVLPISKASKLLELQIKEIQQSIQSTISMGNKLVKRCEQNLQRAERDYPQLMDSLHAFYMELHQLLIDKKNEQLKFLNDTWVQIRYFNHSMRTEVKQIMDYTRERISDINELKGEESLLFKYNISNELKKLDYHINEDLVPEENNKYFAEIKKFEKLKESLIQSLVLTEHKTKKEIITSTVRLFRKDSKNHQKQAKLKEVKTIDRSLQQSLQKLDEQEKGSVQEKSLNQSLKNRHGKKQVKIKMQLSEKKVALQRKRRKKSISLSQSRSKSKLAESASKKNISSSKKPCVSPTKRQIKKTFHR